MKIESRAKQAAKIIVAVFIFADGGGVEVGGVASCWAEVNDMGWSECMWTSGWALSWGID